MICTFEKYANVALKICYLDPVKGIFVHENIRMLLFTHEYVLIIENSVHIWYCVVFKFFYRTRVRSLGMLVSDSLTD